MSVSSTTTCHASSCWCKRAPTAREHVAHPVLSARGRLASTTAHNNNQNGTRTLYRMHHHVKKSQHLHTQALSAIHTTHTTPNNKSHTRTRTHQLLPPATAPSITPGRPLTLPIAPLPPTPQLLKKLPMLPLTRLLRRVLLAQPSPSRMSAEAHQATADGRRAQTKCEVAPHEA